MEALGKFVQVAAPFIGTGVGMLVNNIIRIEGPPMISNEIIDKTAEQGRKWLGTFGYWAGKMIGGYYGVKAANNPVTREMIGWLATGGGVAAGFATTALTMHIGNRLRDVTVSEETKGALTLVGNLHENIDDQQIRDIVDVIINSDYYIGANKITEEKIKNFFDEQGADLTATKLKKFIEENKVVKYKIRTEATPTDTKINNVYTNKK